MCTVFALTIYSMSLNSAKIRAAVQFQNASSFINTNITNIQTDIKNHNELILSSEALQKFNSATELNRKQLAHYLAEACELGGLSAVSVFDDNGEPVVFAFSDNGLYYSGYRFGEKTELFFKGSSSNFPASSGLVSVMLNEIRYSEDRFIFSDFDGILAVEYFNTFKSENGNIRLMTASFMDENFVREVMRSTGLDFTYYLNGKTIFDSSEAVPSDVKSLFPLNHVVPEDVIRKNGRNVFFQRWVLSGNLTADFVFFTSDVYSDDMKKNIFTGFMVILLVVFLVVVPVSFFILHRAFSKPIRELEKAVKKVESVGYTTMLTIQREDEIGELVRSYNEMIRRIKQKEQELEAMNLQLESMFRQESGKRIKNEQLLFDQQKFVDMGQMVNAIAHQWRQPLNIIGLSVQSFVINYREDRLDVDEAEEFENKVMSMLMHMSSTIDDFRNFFRTDKTLRTFSAVQNMLEVIRLIGAQMKYNAINLSFTCRCAESTFVFVEGVNESPDCACGDAMVTGFPGELKQAVLNIIQNAKDAILSRMRNGEISEGQLEIIMQYADGKIIISIKDNGGGVDNGIIDKIFDPYFTTKGNENGTGIGLYMTKSIVEKHMNGEIKLENIDDGAVFYIILPTAQDGDIQT